MTFPMFPSLIPRIVENTWFSVDVPQNDLTELDSIEIQHNNWRISIARREFKGIPTVRCQPEPRRQDEDGDEEDEDNEDQEEDDNSREEDEDEEEDEEMDEDDVLNQQMDNSEDSGILSGQAPMEININVNRINIPPR